MARNGHTKVIYKGTFVSIQSLSKQFCSSKAGNPGNILLNKGGFKSEDTGEFLHCQYKYSKSLSRAEN